MCDWPPSKFGKGGVRDKGQEQQDGGRGPQQEEKGASLPQTRFLLEAWILLALGRYDLCCNCAKWN